MSYPSGPKSEWLNQALLIKTGEIQVEDNDLPMLLKWMQDMNWPGASTIAEFLRDKGDAMLDPLRNALRAGDSIWSHWLLNSFGEGFDAAFWKELLPELKAVASIPDEESAHISALILLAKHSLLPRQDIQKLACQTRAVSGLPHEDYLKLDAYFY